MISASCVTDTIAVYYGYDCRVLRIVFITSVGIIGCLFFVRWPQNISRIVWNLTPALGTGTWGWVRKFSLQSACQVPGYKVEK